jgi:hypothetical protein
VSDGRFQYILNYYPDLPHYQNIAYRLQQKSMTEIIRLREAGLLNSVQMRWFNPTKPREELYDTENDPNQFINLADDPAYLSKLKELRNQHSIWQKKYGDMGEIPEKQMINNMWNSQSKPPKTEKPVVSIRQNTITINCPTAGALIAYRIKSTNTWMPYTKKIIIKSGEKMEVIARRIGYEPSEIEEIGD